jgi:DNA-binding CsgD family transcriptional regulator
MTKELLLEIISKNLYFELIVIMFVYSVLLFVLFSLSFRILDVKIKTRKMLPGIFITLIYAMLGKQILPNVSYGLIFVCLLIFLFKVIGKVTILRAIWASLLTYLIDGIGVIVIQVPLLSLNRNISEFILKTPYGVACGSLIELLFPAIALFLLTIYDISLIPHTKNRISKVDALGILLFGLFFFIIYSTTCRIVVSLNSNSKFDLISNIISEWLASIGGAIVFFLIHDFSKKERERERLMHLEEKAELVKLIDELVKFQKDPINNEADPQKMLDTIAVIVNKLNGMSRDIVQENQRRVIANAERKTKIRFSPKEIRILELLVQGKSNKEIGAILNLKEGSVKNRFTKLLDRTGLEDRVQLAVFAVTNGIVKNIQIDSDK